MSVGGYNLQIVSRRPVALPRQKCPPKKHSFGSRKLAENAPLYFATPDVHLPDGMFDGTVGHALFVHSVLTLDLRDMKVWMSE